jgi:Zn-dependent M28 family amino/carboxypeptidase
MIVKRFGTFAGAIALLGLSTGCAVHRVAPLSVPAAVELFAGAATDVARMERDSNEGRFDVLTGMLAARKIPFEVERFTIDPRKAEPRVEGRNIVVTIAGRLPEIVVGAHFDAARLPDGALSKGAVDNAASSIILVRLAERLSDTHLRHQVRIVFFDMEELGLLGSARFVDAHRGRPVRAMLNLDVNAFGDTLIYGPRNAANADIRRAFQDVCSESGQRCIEFPQMPPSDDRSFVAAGTPAVSMASVPEAEAHQLWLLMNGEKPSGLAEGFAPHVLRIIHTPADASSLVEPTTMARVFRTALSLITKLDRN